jgi:hypothetical protein
MDTEVDQRNYVGHFGLFKDSEMNGRKEKSRRAVMSSLAEGSGPAASPEVEREQTDE